MLRLANEYWVGLYFMFMSIFPMIIFFYGFIPRPSPTQPLADWSDLPNQVNGLDIDNSEMYGAKNDTIVVLAVIEGLRFDFIDAQRMPFVSQVLQNKTACVYTTATHTPSFTLPRIQTLMSGAQSSFLRDLNTIVTRASEKSDNVFRLAHTYGRRSAVVGDRLWLDLYSKYVIAARFAEPDNFILRNLPIDLDSEPMVDFLVFQFQELDRLGHAEGAHGPNIKAKLNELDEFLSSLFTIMNSWEHESVLLVYGGHGMRAGAGRGGATGPEVFTPLVVTRTEPFYCPYVASRGPLIPQADIAPTLAWLLNLPLPADSIGRILPSILPPAHSVERLYILHYLTEHNARLVLKLRGEKFVSAHFYKQLQVARHLFQYYLTTQKAEMAQEAQELYEDCLDDMTILLTKKRDHFESFAIFAALDLLYVMFVSMFCTTLYSLQKEDHLRSYIVKKFMKTKSHLKSVCIFITLMCVIVITLKIACKFLKETCVLCNVENHTLMTVIFGIAVATSISLMLTSAVTVAITDVVYLKDLKHIDYLLIIFPVMHFLAVFHKRYVEEEAEVYYWLWNVLMCAVLLNVARKLVKCFHGNIKSDPQDNLKDVKWICIRNLLYCLLTICVHRYLRSLNQDIMGPRDTVISKRDSLKPKEFEIGLILNDHLLFGVSLTLFICSSNLHYTNNMYNLQRGITFFAGTMILCYHQAEGTVLQMFNIKSYVSRKTIISMFTQLLSLQVIIELILHMSSLIKAVKMKIVEDTGAIARDLKEVNENASYADGLKLKCARSLTYIILNDVMLVGMFFIKTHNAFIVPSCYVTCSFLSNFFDNKPLIKKEKTLYVLRRTLTCLYLGLVFFFYQGNIKSLTSMDRWMGLREQVSGPILTAAILFAELARNSTTWQRYKLQVWRTINIIATLYMFQACAYGVVLATHRHHLMIWAVFAPKFIYDCTIGVAMICLVALIVIVICFAHCLVTMAEGYVTLQGSRVYSIQLS